MSLSGEAALSGENTSAFTGDMLDLPLVQTGDQLSGIQDTIPILPEDLTKEVSMLEAIQHLLTHNNIPLSTAKNVRFKYLTFSDEAYPYMKTALEKKMIGSNTDPKMIVSCEVYMVMKGLAEGWTIKPSADVKADYWNVAVAKDALKGCQKGKRLTFAQL